MGQEKMLESDQVLRTDGSNSSGRVKCRHHSCKFSAGGSIGSVCYNVRQPVQGSEPSSVPSAARAHPHT